MSGRPKPTKAGKRGSKPPEATGDSSDSGRSRSLSAGRTSSRKVESKGKAKTQSKWNPSQYISTSEDDEKNDFSDSVSKRVKFRREKNTKELAKSTADSLKGFKIPKNEALKDNRQLLSSSKLSVDKLLKI